MAVKGKEIAGKSSTRKRKSVSKSSAAAEKSCSRRKRRSGIMNFVDDEAVDADSDGEDGSDGEDEDDRDFLDDIESEVKDKNESGGARHLPFLVKEEELSDEELENLLKRRYRRDSQHVVYADESKETKDYYDRESLMHSMKDPTIWRVRCSVGRERYVAFCLFQKFVDVQCLGTKLNIVSAFALEHMKGHIFIEADREFDVVEACKGVCSIYASKMTLVPKSEVPHLLSVRDKASEISEGTWVRMKCGAYKGDLAQVVSVDNVRKRATIKLIPRIDLQAITQKLKNGVPAKQSVVPTPRLISSRELEDFRSHIQYRHDRQTGETFEIIDGLMLKNGYVYKKVSLGSLGCWEVQPSPEEIQKFKVADDAYENSDWLSDIYGGRKKILPGLTGGGTSENTEGILETDGDSFELHDLVLFDEIDFGVIIGLESHTFQILKGDPERADTTTVNIWEIKSKCLDKKFAAQDMHNNVITINDSVRVLDGPFKGRQGVVKHMYRGTVFIHDSNESENDGFLCTKPEFCENTKHSTDTHNEMDDGIAPPGFEDPTETQKVPEPYQRRESNRPFNRDQGGRDNSFSIGQTLRIRVGPLKGHLCRVVAIYRSDVTVKLDSQPKVIKVNSELLSEAGTRSCGNLTKDSLHDSSASVFLGISMDADPFGTISSSDNDRTGETGDPWGNATWRSGNQTSSSKAMDSWDKVAPSSGDQNTSWTRAADGDKAVGASKEQTGSWERDAHGWDKATAKSSDGGGWTDNWQKKAPTEDPAGNSNDVGSWGKAKLETEHHSDHPTNETGGWETKKGVSNDQADCWKKSENNWDKGKGIIQDHKNSWEKGDVGNDMDSWGKTADCQGKDGISKTNRNDPWGKSTGSWKGIEESSGNQSGSWKNATAGRGNQGGGWEKVSEHGAQPEFGDGGKSGGWDKSKGEGGGQSGNWDKFKGTSEGDSSSKKSEFGSQCQTDGWNRPKPFSNDRASSWNGDKGGRSNQSGGWNKQNNSDGGHGSDWSRGRMGNFDEGGNRDQEGGWNKPKTFDGDRGFGGRRGRGRGNSGRGGRNYSDREKPFGGNQASGWTEDGGGSWNKPKDSDGGGSWNSPKDSDGGGSWNKPKDSDGGWGSGWNGGKGNFEGGNANQEDGWNKPKSFDGGRGFGGRRGRGGGNRGRGDQASGWNGDGGGRRDQAQDWNNKKDFDGGSDWNGGFGGSADQEDGWNKPKTYDGGRGFGGRRGRGGGNRGRGGRDYSDRAKPFDQGQSSSWNRGPETSSGNMSSGWNNRNQDASGNENQGDGWKASDGDHGSGWNKEWSTGKEAGGSGGQASGWKASDQGHGSDWNKGSSTGKEVSGSGGQSSGWKASGGGHGSSWNKRWSAGKEAGGSGGGQSSGWDKDRVEYPSEAAAGGSHAAGGWNQGGKTLVGDNASGWNQEATPDRTTGRADQSGGWDKAAGGSWGEGGGGAGSSKGGW